MTPKNFNFFPEVTPEKRQFENVLSGSEALVVADFLNRASETNTALLMVESETEALHQSRALAALCSTWSVQHFPAWNTVPYDRMSPDKKIMAQRLQVLAALKNTKEKHLLVVSPQAFLQRLVTPALLKTTHLTFKVGSVLSFADLKDFFLAQNYEKVDLVREPGEYAVRGGVVDFFPPDHFLPVRLDFFGDEIESIATFSPATQRTEESLETLTLAPSSEIPLTAKNREMFKVNYIQQFGVKAAEDPLVLNLLKGATPQGYEQWFPLLTKQTTTLQEWLSAKSWVFVSDSALKACQDFLGQVQDYFEQRKQDLKDFERLKLETSPYRPILPEALYQTKEAISDFVKGQNVVHFNGFKTNAAPALTLQTFLQEKIYDEDSIAERLESLKAPVIVFENQTQYENFQKRYKSIPLSLCTACAALTSAQRKGRIAAFILPLRTGFILKDITLVPAHRFLDQTTAKKKRRKKSEGVPLDLSSYEPGDFLVHREHGVGHFEKLVTLDINGAEHDCVQLCYANDTKLYVPVENLEVLTKYAGALSDATLDQLGTSHWQKRSAKVKQKIFEVAEKLMALAASRQVQEGLQINVLYEQYQEFCQRFPYAETDDQERAIAEVLEDLAGAEPMDRLICGDVGFGKTEVALRAAFATVLTGYQVIVLVPTTILCRQHTNNFAERFSPFGYNVKQLSRFCTAAQKKQVLKDFAAGDVHVLVATHGVLRSKLETNALGLIIVDEEQHFGVLQKEHLKSLQSNINVLSMSATPIPRTLQMALSGMRSLSLIATPPMDRMAIRSFVIAYDTIAIREAVVREVHRGGQVYFVCPRIKDLEKVAPLLEEVLPRQVKMAKAHGQMSMAELDNIMTDFYAGQYDVLLATNIVESGLDVPNANTMIIYRADLFGLSQLYQLRGRIGRGNKRAFAYFTYTAEDALSNAAKKRLEVLQSLDKLGAGFSLASHDMDIRGAGNLVGKQQSGHIKEVGFELYQQLLKEAVESLNQVDQNQQASKDILDFSPQINLGVSLLIPEVYIPDLTVRMALYKKASAIKTLDEVDAFKEELIDRFGRLPADVKHFILVLVLKCLCKELHVLKIDAGDKAVVITFYQNTPPKPEVLLTYVQRNLGRLKLKPDGKLLYMQAWDVEEERLKGVIDFMQKLLITLLPEKSTPFQDLTSFTS